MKRLTALVVDDHARLRAMIAQILVGGGFDVIAQAADGAQALDIASRLVPDLITLDISMPGMTGLRALTALRRQLPGAVIVMLTMNQHDENEARQRGADAYVLKRRAVHHLIPSIRAVLADPSGH